MTIPPISGDQVQIGPGAAKSRQAWADRLPCRLSALRPSRKRVGRRIASCSVAKTRWQGSLRLRVVSTTLVASAIVVSLLGFFLMQQITANLLHKAEETAITQASDGLTFAQSQPSRGGLPWHIVRAVHVQRREAA